MRNFLFLLLLPLAAVHAIDTRFGFVGTGGKAFSEKFNVPYYTLEGNYPVSGSVFSSVDPNNDPKAGHKVVREVSKLNVRNDGLGQTNAEFQTAFQAYVQSLATWYIFSFGTKPQFTWYSPNAAALAAAESLQIVTTIRREKTLNPAVTGTVWEIGNEPNLFPALLPAQYADIFSRYYQIIKNEDATAKVAFGSIFLRETAEDLKPKMVEVLHQMLLDAGVLSILGQTKFNSLEIDVQNTLFARIFNLGTVEYVSQTLAAMSSSIHPDYVTLHTYPYDDRAPALSNANIKTKIDSLVTSLGAVMSARSFSAPIWITEFGNIDAALAETTITLNTSNLIDVFAANPGIGNWFYYKATGADQQVALIGTTPALTRLAADSAFDPVDGSFSCTQLNKIGRMYYLRAVGTACVDPGAPGAPTGVAGTRGNAQVAVSWLAPASDGGSTITGYTVTAMEDASKHCSTTGALNCTVTTLTNGTAYTFTVTAANILGTGPSSAASSSVTPATVPDAPTAVAGTRGNTQVAVFWLAPPFNGGSIITSYKAMAVLDTTKSCTTTGALNCTITTLTNGTSYSFIVKATNAIGAGVSSAASATVIPATVPGAPTGVAGTRGNAQVALSWFAPASTGGSAITGYTVTALQDSTKSCSTTGAPNCIVTALTNGASYNFRVKAANAVGTSAFSATSATFIPATVPDAPTGVTGASGNTQIVLSWFAPASNGGSSITAYTATSVEDTSKHCSTTGALNCTVTALTNGTSYTFTVKASNTLGTGASSLASAAVIPAAVPGVPTGLAGLSGNAQVALSWLAPASSGGSPITAYTATSVEDTSKHCSTTGALNCAITALTNGIPYTFTIKATNTAGTGPSSAPSATVIPATVPGVPTAALGVAGNATVTVSWTAPILDGGAAITGYTATSVADTSKHCSTTGLNCIVTGLINGTTYSFNVKATNSAGSSAASVPSIAVIPSTVPGVPTGVVGTRGNAQVSLIWQAPASTGGIPITGYTATAVQDTSKHCSTTGLLTCIVTSLNNGTVYRFTVRATNATGTGAASVQSAAVTPATLPNPPGTLTAIAGNATAALSWLAPDSNGGLAIAAYTAISAQDTSKHCSTTTALTCTVAGLTNGATYTFTVTARNAVGLSAASAPSSEITPSTVPSAPTGLTRTGSNGRVSLAWVAPDSNGGAALTGYTAVSVQDTGKHCVTDSLACIITGLNNGTSYTFTVTASNTAGTSPASSPSTAVVPTTIPAAPKDVIAVGSGAGQITVSWAAPDSNGGDAIIAYTATALEDGSKTCGTFGGLACVVTGLTGSASYTFAVSASNSTGTGPASQPSTPVTAISTRLGRALGFQATGTSLILKLPEFSGKAQVSIVDLWGRTVWDKTVGPETREVVWNHNTQGQSLLPGVYIARLSILESGRNFRIAAQSKITLAP